MCIEGEREKEEAEVKHSLSWRTLGTTSSKRSVSTVGTLAVAQYVNVSLKALAQG